jgi:hypothetical protein
MNIQVSTSKNIYKALKIEALLLIGIALWDAMHVAAGIQILPHLARLALSLVWVAFLRVRYGINPFGGEKA